MRDRRERRSPSMNLPLTWGFTECRSLASRSTRGCFAAAGPFRTQDRENWAGCGSSGENVLVAPELASVEFPPHGYEGLLGLLMSSLPRRGRSRQLHAVGVAFGEDLARSMSLRPAPTLPGAVEEVCRALGEVGFHAAVEGAKTAKPGFEPLPAPSGPSSSRTRRPRRSTAACGPGSSPRLSKTWLPARSTAGRATASTPHRACRVQVRISAPG